MLDRSKEAITHMESVTSERGDLDVNYLMVLSTAYKIEKEFGESMRLLEAAMKLAPEDPEIPHLAARVAALTGDKTAARRYVREARRLGMAEGELAMLVGLADFVSANGRPE